MYLSRKLLISRLSLLYPSFYLLIFTLVTPLYGQVSMQTTDSYEEVWGGVCDVQLEQLREDPALAGAVVGFIRDDSEAMIFLGSSNLKTMQPVAADTLFEIGSITKVFTGLLLAHAVQEGKLSLDDHVSDLLSEKGDFSNLKGVTLKDLTTHHSGLPKVMESTRSILKTAFLFYTNKNPYGYYTVDDVLEYIGEYDISKTYGEYRYSNIGVGLLGYILTRAYGKTYEELLHDYVFQPYGMAASCISIPESDELFLAQGYKKVTRDILDYSKITFDVSVYWDLPEIIMAAGGIRSNGQDMMQFMKASLAPESDSAVLLSQSILKEGTAFNFAYNWLILKEKVKGHFVLFHNGGTGGFRSCIMIIPDLKTGVFILANSQLDVDLYVSRILQVLVEKSVH